MKLVIDAGHGGSDPGAVGIGGRREKDDNLRMALALEKLFVADGHEALLTRKGDSYPTLQERVALANNNKVDLFLSCHRNAHTDSTANGIEVLVYPTGSATSKQVAAQVVANLTAVAGKNRGVKEQGTNTYVLKNTTMPAVTVELGFVTNAEDNALFDTHFDAYMQAIYDGVIAVMAGTTTNSGTNTGNSSTGGTTTADSAEKTRIKEGQTALNTAYKSGLAVDGIIGAKTEAAITKNQLKKKSPNMKGAFVTFVQKQLLRLGYSVGSTGADGVYGTNTIAAVKSFQKQAGITVDGIVGKHTVKKLVE